MKQNQGRSSSPINLFMSLILILGLYFFMTKNTAEDKPSEAARTNTASVNSQSAKENKINSSSHLPTPKKSDKADEPTRAVAAATSPAEEKLFFTNQSQVDQYVKNLLKDSKSDFEFDEATSKILSDSVFKIYRYSQKFQGYPVFAAELKIFVSADSAQLIRTQSTLVEIDHLPPTSFQTAEEALKNMLSTNNFADRQVQIKSQSPQLFVKENAVHFIYDAHVKYPNSIGKSEVVIFDANSGEILARYPTALN